MIELDALEDLIAYERLYVGFSGGLDSTVLLHCLAQQPELQLKIQAIHINHGLSANAAQWQAHCQHVCQQWGIPFTAIAVSVAQQANIEQAARIARYNALAPLIQIKQCLLMGHHLDDQAETVLLQLFRGAGVDGLAAISSISSIGKGDLRRPLLSFSRQRLEAYAQYHQLIWIDDESNDNVCFSRNFLRHQVIPLLQEKWPGVSNNLVRSAQHCQQAQANLYDLAISDCQELTTAILPINILLSLTPARINNVLRYWLRHNQIRLPNTATFERLLSEVIYAKEDANPMISWDGIQIRRYQQHLYLLRNSNSKLQTINWSAFPQPLHVTAGILRASKSSCGLLVKPGSKVEVRFRQGGETLRYHGHKHTLKKLMQQWCIPPWLRESIPLIYINNQLVAVVDFAYDDFFYQQSGEGLFEMHLERV